ncbi:MAG TPA: hypothetical protein VGE21_03665 [Flavobacteriales bacterium]
MNGKHPIDDLFARGLSDAEATPPAAVWEGIVRKRGSGHRFALLLRRYWGLGLLLLLLGGSATYALHLNGKGGNAVATTDAPQPSTAARTTNAGVPAAQEVAEAARPLPVEQPVGPISSTASGKGTAPVATPAAAIGRPASAAPGRSGSTPSTSASGPSPRPRTNASASLSATESDRTPERTPTKPSAVPADGASLTASTAPALRPEAGPIATRYAAEPSLLDPSVDYFATPVQGRVVGLERPSLLGSPERASGTAHYAPPKGTWWFGVFGGAYTEERSWTGGDADLREALERTEVPHYPLGVGIALGHAWPSGFHLGTGVELIRSRYDFRHDDRFVTENTEVHNFVVALDANVLVNISDTVVTTSETLVQQKAMNRYSTLRIPVEVGWQHTWRRWHYGIRGGAAVEHITQQGGYTLQRVPSGSSDATDIRSVDALDGPRRTILLSGLVGLDLGYSLSENLVLGVTPTYAKGLTRLSSTPDPFTVPERIGIRVGLTYSIPHP